MKFDFDITKKESKNTFGDPPPSGTYLFVITNYEDFVADSGTSGVNPTLRILRSNVEAGEKDQAGKTKDPHKFQGRSARPTLWTNEKNAGRYRNFLDTAKIPYTASGHENSDAIGKSFWGRINSYIEDGFPRADLLTWEAAKPELLKEYAGLIAEWVGQDSPPENLQSADTTPPPRSGGSGAAKGREASEKIDTGDDDVPF